MVSRFSRCVFYKWYYMIYVLVFLYIDVIKRVDLFIGTQKFCCISEHLYIHLSPSTPWSCKTLFAFIALGVPAWEIGGKILFVPSHSTRKSSAIVPSRGSFVQPPASLSRGCEMHIFNQGMWEAVPGTKVLWCPFIVLPSISN